MATYNGLPELSRLKAKRLGASVSPRADTDHVPPVYLAGQPAKTDADIYASLDGPTREAIRQNLAASARAKDRENAEAIGPSDDDSRVVPRGGYMKHLGTAVGTAGLMASLFYLGGRVADRKAADPNADINKYLTYSDPAQTAPPGNQPPGYDKTLIQVAQKIENYFSANADPALRMNFMADLQRSVGPRNTLSSVLFLEGYSQPNILMPTDVELDAYLREAAKRKGLDPETLRGMYKNDSDAYARDFLRDNMGTIVSADLKIALAVQIMKREKEAFGYTKWNEHMDTLVATRGSSSGLIESFRSDKGRYPTPAEYAELVDHRVKVYNPDERKPTNTWDVVGERRRVDRNGERVTVEINPYGATPQQRANHRAEQSRAETRENARAMGARTEAESRAAAGKAIDSARREGGKAVDAAKTAIGNFFNPPKKKE